MQMKKTSINGVVDVSFRDSLSANARSLQFFRIKNDFLKVSHESNMHVNKKLIGSALGIFVCYFYFGILQEKITRSSYGDGEKFTFATSLIFCQCIVNCILAKIMLHTIMKQGEDPTKQKYYCMTACCYFTAMITSTMALRHVNYPTQVIGKSCKPIPVMILGVLIARKSYSLAKYMFVFMIVMGVCIFMYKDQPVTQSAATDDPILGKGEILLLISLFLDGVIGAIQDRMRAEFQSKSAHMMYSTNLWSTCILLVVVCVTGEIWEFLQFLQKYPFLVYNVLSFSVTSALGQVFIYIVVSEFGPLPCSIVTTTRKFFTVLASIFFFNNVISNRQWFGTALVFAGLTLDALYGKQSSPKKQ